MLFPNIQMRHADCSAQDTIIEKSHGWLAVARGYGTPPFEHDATTYRMIEACTATDDEISARSELGEFSFDIIDEHMSYLWFRDRGSFKAAWRMARVICSGRLVECGNDCRAGDVFVIDRLNHQPVAPFWVLGAVADFARENGLKIKPASRLWSDAYNTRNIEAPNWVRDQVDSASETQLRTWRKIRIARGR